MKDIYKRANGKIGVRIINDKPTMTQQQFKDEVNVNNIMKRYQRTREITHLNNRRGVYADISNAQGYFESLNVIRKANEAFDQLPSPIRARFSNDPAALLEFIHNPDNYDEAVKLGIFDPKQGPLCDVSSPAPKKTVAKNDDDLNDDEKKPTKK
ncbi:internal scaffolding protein [Apis mellifera associated microvirus 23]|nr:internal scaffolding protein [Apis mellifera associated microvirus 23]